MSPIVGFSLIAAALVLGVLAVLLRPMWRESRGVVIGFAVAFGLAALALYRVVGTPAGLDARQAAMPQTLDDAIAQLQAQLAKDPNQPEGWRLLGQALATEQRLPEARDAYAHAASLSPRDADVLVAAAQAGALGERRVEGDATVFVIARAQGGPPMPIAVERHTVSELPLDIVLDDGDSPMPTQKLSASRAVEVLARISTSGDAVPQPGDLESPPVPVALPTDAPVDLSIGAVRR